MTEKKKNPVKVGLVYTVTTPELVSDVEREIKNQLGDAVEFFSQEDETILNDIKEAGRVTTAPAARLIGMYMKAAEAGCDAILNICSSVGEVADAAQDLAAYIGVPIVRIDELMLREALRMGERIGVVATLKTTLSPTENTIRRLAREMNRNVTLTDCLVDAFGLAQPEFKDALIKGAAKIADQVDVIVLAQGSMAYAASDMSELLKKPVLESPSFGAKALKKALAEKGVIAEDEGGAFDCQPLQ